MLASHFKVLCHLLFVCDGQGAVRQGILYADRSCYEEKQLLRLLGLVVQN